MPDGRSTTPEQRQTRKAKRLLRDVHNRVAGLPPINRHRDPGDDLEDVKNWLYVRWRALIEEVNGLPEGDRWVELPGGDKLEHHAIRAAERAGQELAYVSARMVEIGLEDRRVAAGERLAEQWTRGIQAVVDRLDLTAEQRRALPDAVRAGLPLVIEGDGRPVVPEPRGGNGWQPPPVGPSS